MPKKQSALVQGTTKSWKKARQLSRKTGKGPKECRSILAANPNALAEAKAGKRIFGGTRKPSKKKKKKAATRRKSQSQEVTTDFITALADTKAYVDSMGGFDEARNQITALETITQQF